MDPAYCPADLLASATRMEQALVEIIDNAAHQRLTVLGAVRIAEEALGIAEFSVADAMRDGLWGDDQP